MTVRITKSGKLVGTFPEYSVKCFRLTEIVRILQYPRYLFHINELYDDRGSSIIENILCHGQIDQLKIVHDQLTAEGALSGSPNEVEEYSRQINDVFKHLGTVQSVLSCVSVLSRFHF